MTERIDKMNQQFEALRHKWRSVPLLTDAASRAQRALGDSGDMYLFVDKPGIYPTITERVSYKDATLYNSYPFRTFRLRYDLHPLEGPLQNVKEQLQVYINARDRNLDPRLSIMLVSSDPASEVDDFQINLDEKRDGTSGELLLTLDYLAEANLPVDSKLHFTHRLRTLSQVKVPNFPAEFIGWTDTLHMQVQFQPKV
jgi:hypothetical protein